jgi:biopolymer transport protein ExbD
MKKCSQSVHQSLTELNITPLLDLAFVLLVIFIITTIPPVNDLDLKLPTAAKRLKEPPRKANYISVQADGKLFLNQKQLASADEMLQTLIGLREADPDLNVIVRGDG